MQSVSKRDQPKNAGTSALPSGKQTNQRTNERTSDRHIRKKAFLHLHRCWSRTLTQCVIHTIIMKLSLSFSVSLSQVVRQSVSQSDSVPVGSNQTLTLSTDTHNVVTFTAQHAGSALRCIPCVMYEGEGTACTALHADLYLHK